MQTVSLLEHALDYAADGYEVFPLAPKDRPNPTDPKKIIAAKQPLTRTGFKEASSDSDKIERWWTRDPDALIGCRVPPELMLLDIDPRHGAQEVWAALTDTYGSLTSRCHFSGRGDGGFHIWLYRPGGKLVIKQLNDWAKERGMGKPVADGRRWTAGIDLLHHNSRYTILPPSPHPETGGPYTWAADEVPIADCPAWLADILTAEPAPEPKPRLSSTYQGESVADWFSEMQSWNDLLPRHGWVAVGGDGDSDGSKWRHPEATSAVSAAIRHHCLFVFSTSTAFEPSEDGDPNGYTLFKAFAELDHGGDLSAAAKAAGKLPGAPEIKKTDMDAFIAANSLPELHVDEEGEWLEPRPIDAVATPGPFPVEVLPDWIADRVRNVAESVSTPVDLPAMVALGALATACMGKVTVGIKDDYIEETNLYLAIAMPPSSGKSPVFKRMTKALYEAEAEFRELAEPKILAAQNNVKAVEKEVAKAINRGADASEITSLSKAEHEARKAVPSSPQLISDDATPEAFAELLDANEGRMAIMSTEGGPFEMMAGRYSEGNKSRLEVYLGAWSGDTVRVNRIRRDEPIIIPKALASLLVTVQPVVLQDLAKDMRGKGLTARIMYSLPPHHRKDYRAPSEPQDVAEEYDRRLGALVRKWRSVTYGTTLMLAPQARERWMDFAQEISDRTMGDLAGVAEWVGKMTASVARVAALLHVAAGTDTNEISEARIVDAIKVGEYWLEHALAVHELWDVDGTTRRAHAVIEHVHAAGELTFKPRDVYFSDRRTFPDRGAFDDAVALLIDAGWVRLVEGKHGAHGSSKDAPTYEMNPKGTCGSERCARCGQFVGNEAVVKPLVGSDVVDVVDVVHKACISSSSSSFKEAVTPTDTAPPPQRPQRPQRDESPDATTKRPQRAQRDDNDNPEDDEWTLI